jgi:hypothetical protein
MNSKDGGGPAQKVKLSVEVLTADIVDALLPFNDNDAHNMKQYFAKTRTREQLQEIIKTFINDPYKAYSFQFD